MTKKQIACERSGGQFQSDSSPMETESSEKFPLWDPFILTALSLQVIFTARYEEPAEYSSGRETEDIRGRTLHPTPPLAVDLRRIDFPPLRGISEAAAAETGQQSHRSFNNEMDGGWTPPVSERPAEPPDVWSPLRKTLSLRSESLQTDGGRIERRPSRFHLCLTDDATSCRPARPAAPGLQRNLSGSFVLQGGERPRLHRASAPPSAAAETGKHGSVRPRQPRPRRDRWHRSATRHMLKETTAA